MIGFIRLIYADFGFVLLLVLFVLLGMIKSFPLVNDDEVPN
jgi:hypothetical protein